MDIFEQVAQMKLEEARQEGKRIAIERFVRRMLTETEFSDERIAAIAHIPSDQVATVRKELA